LVAVQRACIEQAIDNAVRSVNAVALTELRFAVRSASPTSDGKPPEKSSSTTPYPEDMKLQEILK